MAIMVRKGSGARHIDEGEYTAVIMDIQEKESENKKWGDTFLMWQFKVNNPTEDENPIDEEVTITGLTSTKFSEKSNLGKWLAGLGIDLDTAEEFDVEEFIGKVVRITVEDKPNKKDGKVFSTVSRVRAAKKKAHVVEDDAPEEAPAPVAKAAPKPAPATVAKPAAKPAAKPVAKVAVEEPEEPAEEVAEEDDAPPPVQKKTAVKVTAKPVVKKEAVEEAPVEEEEDGSLFKFDDNGEPQED
jgi:hypothetical protein